MLAKGRVVLTTMGPNLHGFTKMSGEDFCINVELDVKMRHGK